MYLKNSENFATNTEAIENIVSMYNAGNLTATNFKATNEIIADGNIAGNNLYVGNTVYAGTTTNPWAIQPWMNGTKSQLSIGTMLPSGAANPASVQIHSNGDLTTAANIAVNALYAKSIFAQGNCIPIIDWNKDPGINSTTFSINNSDNVQYVINNGRISTIKGPFTKTLTPGTVMEFSFINAFFGTANAISAAHMKLIMFDANGEWRGVVTVYEKNSIFCVKGRLLY